MPIRVAIVEDDATASATLRSYLERYGQENCIHFQTKTFEHALLFLDPYKADYDLVYMDIQMPMMNGMDAAHCLRDLDPGVALVFVTSLTQYAIEGYEVGALDYIVKPFNYYDFALKLARALKRIPPHDGEDILVSTEAGKVRLSMDSIRYVEVWGHHVIYHTSRGNFTQYTTMAKAEQLLAGHMFARCNSCYLVNLQYVQGVKGFLVNVAGEELKISQPRKKPFVQALDRYMNRHESDP